MYILIQIIKALPTPTLTLADTFIFSFFITSFILIKNVLMWFEIWKGRKISQKADSNPGRLCQK